MNYEEAERLAQRIAGWWQHWRNTPEQVETLFLLFGNYPYDECEDAFRQHKLTDPEDNPRMRRPIFRQVRQDLLVRFRESRPADEAWNWGDECELAYRREIYARQGREWPGDEYFIRTAWKREPPLKAKRRLVQEAIRQHQSERGQPTNIHDLRRKQQDQIRSYMRVREKLAEHAARLTGSRKRWLTESTADANTDPAKLSPADFGLPATQAQPVAEEVPF